MIAPPMTPTASIGAYAFVTIASGRLIRRPTSAPFTRPATGSVTSGIKNPIAKRLANAAINAVRLFGKVIGNISVTANAPKPTPQINESTIGFIRAVPWLPSDDEPTTGWHGHGGQVSGSYWNSRSSCEQ